MRLSGECSFPTQMLSTHAHARERCTAWEVRHGVDGCRNVDTVTQLMLVDPILNEMIVDVVCRL